MAVQDEYIDKVTTAAGATPTNANAGMASGSSTSKPMYQVDYNDPRFTKWDAEKEQVTNEYQQMYGNMIADTDGYYQDLKDATQHWADTQSQLQQDRTDFTIEQIEQQKDQAHKDYVKEQSGAYVDWRKQSNQYGTEAEKMASAGLAGTGFSESSQVSMYNTYQNRIATARESYQNAVLNYNNAIKDAQLQNNAALAEIAYNALQKQLELSLEGFQYKNQLVLDMADKKLEIDQMYYNRWQDTLQQINTENALAEDIRQFNENQKFQAEQAQIERDWKSAEAVLDRQFEEAQNKIKMDFQAKEAQLDRDFQIKLEGIRDKNERERMKEQHKLDMEKLAQQKKNALEQIAAEYAEKRKTAKYEQDLKKTAVTSTPVGKGTKSAGTTRNRQQNISGTKQSVASSQGVTYDSAVAQMKASGVASDLISNMLLQNEFGRGYESAKGYSSYAAYLADYIEFAKNETASRKVNKSKKVGRANRGK